jgi:AraC family transcriptional regulator, positive regulator of tynA and feaB
VWFSGPSTFSIGPGQLAVRDTARPWRFWSAHATVTRWLLVPRAVLLGHRHGALPACHVADDSPDVRFLVSYLEMLTGTVALSDEGARAAQDATLSLLAGVLAGRPGAEAHEHARATVVLARRFIDRHLRDRDVTPAMLARQLGVSPRTLHRSFSSEGDSVMGYVRRRRLHEARRELVTAGASARVADVAARWRFADSSHFTRQFRGTYGTTPAAFLRSL